jgi:flagellar protein FliO/FliZ
VVELVIRVVFSLSVILGLLWFVARTSNKRFGGAARSMVRVVARQPLARSASLAVVEVGDRVLVVGVSENGVSLLTEMDPSELPVEAATPPVQRQDSEATAAALGTDWAVGSVPGTRRATASPSLAGSVLSTQTWRQAWAAATSRGGGSGD